MVSGTKAKAVNNTRRIVLTLFVSRDTTGVSQRDSTEIINYATLVC